MKIRVNKHVPMFSNKKTTSKHMFSCIFSLTFTPHYIIMEKGLLVTENNRPVCILPILHKPSSGFHRPHELKLRPQTPPPHLSLTSPLASASCRSTVRRMKPMPARQEGPTSRQDSHPTASVTRGATHNTWTKGKLCTCECVCVFVCVHMHVIMYVNHTYLYTPNTEASLNKVYSHYMPTCKVQHILNTF